MAVRVIIPPEPIVTPAEIAGTSSDDDAAVKRMISAATRTIDGPSGWLGRALGKQTIELTGWLGCHRRFRLPYPPIIKIVSVSAEDCDRNEVPVDADTWRQDGDEIVISHGASWVREPVHRIRYEAGYDGVDVDAGGTGPVPDEAKQAIILMVQHMRAVGTENLFLRSVEVHDVITKQYTISDKAGALIQRAVENLLSGIRIYSC